MARQIKHAELDGYQASGAAGLVAFVNTVAGEGDAEDTEDVITFNATKLPQVMAILKVAARDALKADSSAEFVVKARAPRSPNKQNKK